jgi:hypothetical protein
MIFTPLAIVALLTARLISDDLDLANEETVSENEKKEAQAAKPMPQGDIPTTSTVK